MVNVIEENTYALNSRLSSAIRAKVINLFFNSSFSLFKLSILPLASSNSGCGWGVAGDAMVEGVDTGGPSRTTPAVSRVRRREVRSTSRGWGGGEDMERVGRSSTKWSFKFCIKTWKVFF